MSCFYPRDAWFATRLNENGKRPIVFNPREGFRDKHIQVPCGKCDGCMADRSKDWAIRMYHESVMHDRNAFLTLTYRDAPDSISRRDCQLFLKRLRRECDVRYFITGEYGERTRRPHYHAVIFGQDFKTPDAVQINEELYECPRLSEIWKQGSVVVGAFTMSSACYVAGYVQKKLGDDDTFSLMSKRPAIGRPFFDKYLDDMVKAGSCVIDGRQYPIPSAYFKWSECLPDDPLYPVKVERLYRFMSMTPEQKLDKYREAEAKEVYQKQRMQEKMYKEKL